MEQNLHIQNIYIDNVMVAPIFDMYMSYGWGSTGETWHQNVPRRDVRPSHEGKDLLNGSITR